MRPWLSVVIPTRPEDCPIPTLRTLYGQSVRPDEIHVVLDAEGRGQSWARNRGAEVARGRWLLFSDADIVWAPDAVERLLGALVAAQGRDADGWRTAYAYGAYEWTVGGRPVLRLGDRPWDLEALAQGNYISTMSLIDGELWRGESLQWDEALRRLEDWDLWLRMAARGLRGVQAPGVLFRTEVRPGVSWGNPLSHREAEREVAQRLGLGPGWAARVRGR